MEASITAMEVHGSFHAAMEVHVEVFPLKHNRVRKLQLPPREYMKVSGSFHRKFRYFNKKKADVPACVRFRWKIQWKRKKSAARSKPCG